MTENLRCSIRGILSHKMRALLTMLGVIIGIAAIIAIVSTIKGTNDQIMKNLIGAGNNNVNVVLQQGDSAYYMDAETPDGVLPITDALQEKIRSLENVKDASFYYSRVFADGIKNGKNELSGSIRGVDAHYLNTCGYSVFRGRTFVGEDYDRFHKVVLLDEAGAAELFPDGGAVGGTLTINNEPYICVGLYQRDSAFQPVINTVNDYYTYDLRFCQQLF